MGCQECLLIEIKNAEEKVEEIIKKYDLPPLDEIPPTVPRNVEVLPETPVGTTDIYDINTGEWTALKTEEDEINSLISRLNRPRVKENQLRREIAERELQAAIRQEEPRVQVVDNPNWVNRLDPDSRKWQLDQVFGTGTDSVSPMVDDFSTMPIVASPEDTPAWLNRGWPDDLPEYDVPILEDGRLAGMQEGVYAPPDLVQSADSAGTVAEEFFPGAGMSAEESRARTQALNEAELAKTLQEIEALKQGGIIEQKTQETSQEILDGLSPAMMAVLEGDPALMEQYLSKREEIMEMLERVTGTTSTTPGGFKTKTRYVSQPLTHEDWYPGSQAAATQAGFWGPLALGWNPKYEAYKDSQRRLMGKQPGERFWSDDWIQNFGWMTPEQINAVIGY